MYTNTLTTSAPFAQDPHVEAEMMHIAEYLKSSGYSAEKLAKLSEKETKALMEKACLYASLKLAELEMGAAFVDSFHHDTTMATMTAVSTAPES